MKEAGLTWSLRASSFAVAATLSYVPLRWATLSYLGLPRATLGHLGSHWLSWATGPGLPEYHQHCPSTTYTGFKHCYLLSWRTAPRLLRSNIPRSALCATLDTYNFLLLTVAQLSQQLQRSNFDAKCHTNATPHPVPFTFYYALKQPVILMEGAA